MLALKPLCSLQLNGQRGWGINLWILLDKGWEDRLVWGADWFRKQSLGMQTISRPPQKEN